MKTENARKNRLGFALTLAMAVLCVVTAIVYVSCYGSQERYMSWLAFAVLLVGGAAGAGLAFLKKYELGAACMAAASFTSLMLYIQIIYLYVVVVYVGIDLKSLDPRFILASVFFVLCFIASLVTVFLPQVVKGEVIEK